MPKTTNMNVRIDSESKKAAEEIYNRLGLSLPDAIRIFVEKTLYVGGLPFDLRLDQPNAETLAAMYEAEQIANDPNAKGYKDLDAMWKELDNE